MTVCIKPLEKNIDRRLWEIENLSTPRFIEAMHIRHSDEKEAKRLDNE